MHSSLARSVLSGGGNAVTTALVIAIFGMIALTVLPAQQAPRPPSRPGLTPQDYIEIQQLVRKYAWALDGGDNYGYAYADLFTPDGVFVGMSSFGASATDKALYKHFGITPEAVAAAAKARLS